MTDERRLAAVLALDVVGYSRMVERDEAGTVARLRAVRRDLVEPRVRTHRGRVVKLTGDGLLLEFASAVEAVTCAVAIQQAANARAAAAPEAERIVFRAGLNLGDLIVDGDDIYGDGVNVAARLESLCEPGGLLISRTVRDQIRDKLAYPFTDRGEHQVKNIARPIRAFGLAPVAIDGIALADGRPATASRRRRWPLAAAAAVLLVSLAGGAAWWHGADRAPATRQRATMPAPRLSIAVLPFVNVSRDPDDAAFADALTEDLIVDLSRISGAFVISSRTAFTYRDPAVDPRQVARDLDIRYVLAGTVRRSGDLIRVTTSLIDGESGAQIWSDRYERARGDMLSLQQTVTAQIARSLNLELKEALSRRALTGSPSGADAQDLAIRAWAEIWNKPQTKATNDIGLALAEQALSIDPENAEAWATKSYALTRAAQSDWLPRPRAELVREAVAAGERAVSLDPRNAEAFFVLAFACSRAGDHERALSLYAQAQQLNPNHAPSFANYGFTLLHLGRFDEFAPWMARARAISPRDPLIPVWLQIEALSRLLQDDAAGAEALARTALARNPRYDVAHLTLAVALRRLGRAEEAEAVLAAFNRLRPNTTIAGLRAVQAGATPAFFAQYDRYLDDLAALGMPRS